MTFWLDGVTQVLCHTAATVAAPLADVIVRSAAGVMGAVAVAALTITSAPVCCQDAVTWPAPIAFWIMPANAASDSARTSAKAGPMAASEVRAELASAR